MSFDRWRARLAGEKVVTYLQPDVDDEGYYRKPITEPKLNAAGHPNGQKRIIGWTAVAYFIERGKLCGVIGDRDMAINEVTDEHLWSWVVRHPITEELYRAVAERGEPWPDLDLKMAGANGEAIPADGVVQGDGSIGLIPAANRAVAKSDNNPPEELPAEVQHAQAIDSAIGAAPTKITSEAEAAVALGSKNRIAELRLAADKAGKAVYEPMYREYKKVQAVWSPIVARAVAAEGKIQTAILTFRESERKRLAKEAADAAAKAAAEQQAIDEANQRAADRAIAAGVAEPAPVVHTHEPPAVAQQATLAPTYGTRKLKEELKKFAVINDDVEVYRHFRADAGLKELIEKLATNAIRSGATVPGATFREGLI